MASTGRASSDFPGLLIQGLPQIFLTPWSVFVLERQDLAQSQVGGSLGTPWCETPPHPTRCSAIPSFCPFLRSFWWVLPLLESPGFGTCWEYQWEFLIYSSNLLPPFPTNIITTFSWFSFCSIFHTPFHSLFSLKRKMLYLVHITKWSTYNFSSWKQALSAFQLVFLLPLSSYPYQFWML